jgi:hypothetical protein
MVACDSIDVNTKIKSTGSFFIAIFVFLTLSCQRLNKKCLIAKLIVLGLKVGLSI